MISRRKYGIAALLAGALALAGCGSSDGSTNGSGDQAADKDTAAEIRLITFEGVEAG
ncbi:hypothetical protein SAMN02910418_01658 [Bowdeniella nasicola]|uniref:Sugar ABC transporter substrate-binding protein n=1 Tax=Bowdeniella nasicola TaxID=208480 RepID=A0A1H4BHF2_9ACTO|nr:hypothetical protein SAMN02910418_01658 [Bowdeniella nasicola]